MRRERISWCLFDFANSAFSTVVVTFVYVQFFRDGLVGDAARGEMLWAWALAFAGVVIAVASPILGGIADRRGRRRRFLVTSSLVSITCTGLLFFPAASGSEAAIWTALALFTVANVAFEVAFSLYNSFLPGLGDDHTVGRLSGYGWALGYVGGLISLALCLVLIEWLPRDGNLHVRATNLLVAGWFLLFSLPMFLFVREQPPTGVVVRGRVRAAIATIAQLRDYPDLLRLFVARLFYNDGLMAIIGLAALYMTGTLGMETRDVLVVAIWLNIAAGFGALGFGFLDDRVGGKPVVVASLVLLIVGIVLAFAVPTVWMFWISATLIGIGMGPNQSASRTLVARMISPKRSAEFYGLFALSGKATVWIGPALFGIVRPHVDDQRIAFLPIVGLLILGFVLVFRVDEQRGIARAAE